MTNYESLVADALSALRRAQGDANRAAASAALVSLGRVYAGDAPSGITYVQPAAWVRDMFPQAPYA